MEKSIKSYIEFDEHGKPCSIWINGIGRIKIL